MPVILLAMLYQKFLPWLDNLKERMGNLQASLWLSQSLEETSRLPAPDAIRRLAYKRRWYCTAFNVFHPRSTEWNPFLWQGGQIWLFSWTRGWEQWPRGGGALTRWRGTALPRVLLSLPRVTRLSLNSEHNHFDSSAPMEPMLENWPMTGQDSALGMGEACSFRSCERTKTNASQSDHVERKAVTAQNTVFCPRIADFTRKCWKWLMLSFIPTYSFSSLGKVLFLSFYWYTAAVQCCVSFRCTAEGVSYTHPLFFRLFSP